MIDRFKPAFFHVGTLQTLITEYSPRKIEGARVPVWMLYKQRHERALGCIPERTFCASRCNSSIYCSNNCYLPPTYEYLLASVQTREGGKRRVEYRNNPLICTNACARARYSAPLVIRPKYEKGWWYSALLYLYLYVLGNCVIDRDPKPYRGPA